MVGVEEPSFNPDLLLPYIPSTAPPTSHRPVEPRVTEIHDSELRPLESPQEKRDPPNYGKLSIFLLGLVVGSMCQTSTIFIMLFIGIVINNQPLPALLGSVTPQELLITIMRNFVRSLFALMLRDHDKKRHAW